MKSNELYQTVTDTIINLLESHLESWERPWIALGTDNDYARNAQSGNHYRGINQFLLSIKMLEKEYSKNTWLTFKQAQELGGYVKKDEKASTIIFFKTGHTDENGKYYAQDIVSSMTLEERQRLGIHTFPIPKLFHVFNTAQVDGLGASYYDIKQQNLLQDFEKDERAEQLINSTNANIEIVQSNRAYYNPRLDKINLPLRGQFKGEAEPFYGTALHELGHWTGHETRLNRDLSGRFGEAVYAKEELIAELTSAFCCAALGFSKTISQNAAYIKSWLDVLRQDNKAVVKAATQAQAAADYIFQRHE